MTYQPSGSAAVPPPRTRADRHGLQCRPWSTPPPAAALPRSGRHRGSRCWPTKSTGYSDRCWSSTRCANAPTIC